MMGRRSKAKTPAIYAPKEDYKRFFKGNSDWHFSYTIMLIGFFVGIFTLAFAGHRTIISLGHLSQLAVGCCVVGMLVPWKWYKNRLGLEKMEILMFNLLGVGPILWSLLLWTNFLFHGPTAVWIHPAVDRTLEQDGLPYITMTLHLENGVLEDNEEFRRFDLRPENLAIMEADGLLLKTAPGALGYGIVLEYIPVVVREQDPQLIKRARP